MNQAVSKTIILLKVTVNKRKTQITTEGHATERFLLSEKFIPRKVFSGIKDSNDEDEKR